jgi:type II secretory pathway component PulJ
MNFQPSVRHVRRVKSAAFTLIEMMIAIGVGVIVIATIVMLAIISAQNFAATANYVQMNDQSRLALDLISREIRNATAVTAFSTNNPQFLRLTNAILGGGATITHSAGTRMLTLSITGQGDRTLLTGCDSFGFKLYNRYPLITSTNISFYTSTNATTGAVDARFCKVINMSWKCSRTILGSKLNTEIVQTAQVVLRNQVSQ